MDSETSLRIQRLLRAGQIAKAKKLLRENGFDHSDYASVLLMGEALFHEKNYIQAVRYFESARTLREGFLPYYWLGLSYERLGSLRNAANMYADAVRIKPGDTNATNRLALLQKKGLYGVANTLLTHQPRQSKPRPIPSGPTGRPMPIPRGPNDSSFARRYVRWAQSQTTTTRPQEKAPNAPLPPRPRPALVIFVGLIALTMILTLVIWVVTHSSFM